MLILMNSIKLIFRSNSSWIVKCKEPIVSGVLYTRHYYKLFCVLARNHRVDTRRDSDDVVTARREMFGRDAVASYFRWHMGILVLSTDVKLIARTGNYVGIIIVLVFAAVLTSDYYMFHI